MSGPSGVSNKANAAINPQLAQLVAETQSDTAMEEAKGADKAARLEAAEIELNIPGAMNADGDIHVTTFNGPEVKSDYKPDADQAEAFLMSSEFQQGQEEIKKQAFVISKLFSDQSMLLIELQQMLAKARDGQQQVSSDLSVLSGEITKGMAENMIAKGYQNFGIQLAGFVTQIGMAAGSMTTGSKAASSSKAETKAYHQNINRGTQGQQQQQMALRKMELEGKQNTPEYAAAQERLNDTQTENRMMTEAHEVSEKGFQQTMLTQQGITQLSSAFGGAVGGGATITDATQQADITRQETTRDQGSDMKNRSNQAIKELEEKIADALRSFRDIEAASTDVIGSVARNI